MDLSLESALNPGESPSDQPGRIAGRPLEDWNAAYAKVESYFHALRLRNKVLLNRQVIHVLKRAMQRAPLEPQRHATELAAEEMDAVVTEWFAQVLQESPTGKDHMLSTRGRLALLIADMPGKWQEQFLRPGPWPEAFVSAMREAYLRAGPDFQLAKMAPRPLDLGPITTLTGFQFPYKKWATIWIICAVALIAFFVYTHYIAPSGK
ncbi:MAG TPA: hypothetical protein VK327_15075 [Candidatus Paceibacterota bacterium]|nr:hypothetical protein [Candidatus Paceibacterota bacterium]